MEFDYYSPSDITSLYTVIPNGEGLLALKHFFDLRTVKEPSSETLLRLAELNVATIEFRFRAIVAYEKIGVAGSHFCAHGHTIDLFIITVSE